MKESLVLSLTIVAGLLTPSSEAQGRSIYWTQAAQQATTVAVLKTVSESNGVQTVEVLAQRGAYISPELTLTGSKPPEDTELWVALLRSPTQNRPTSNVPGIHIAYSTLEIDGGLVKTPPLSQLESGNTGVPLTLFLDAVEASFEHRQGILPDAERLSGLSDCVNHIPRHEGADGPALRRFCAGTLASLGVLPSETAILGLTRSDDERDRFYGIWSMSDHQRRYPTSQLKMHTEILLQALSDPSPSVQSLAAHELLRQSNSQMVENAISELPWSSAQDETSYYPLGRPMVHLPAPRVMMTRALGYLDQSKSGAILLYTQLAHEDHDVAFAALRSLERREDNALVATLLGLLDGADPQRKHLILRALGRLGDPQAQPTLIAILSDDQSSRSAKEQAAVALGMIGDEAAIPHLIAAVQDTDRRIALASLSALGKLGDTSAVPAMGEVLLRPLTYEDFEAVIRSITALGGQEAIALFETQLAREIMPTRRESLHRGIQRMKRMAEADLNDVIRHELLINANASTHAEVKNLMWAVDVVHAHRLVALAPILHDVCRRLTHQAVPQREAVATVIAALNRLNEPLNDLEYTLLNAEEERLGVNL